jgi:hypothetical protein
MDLPPVCFSVREMGLRKKKTLAAPVTCRSGRSVDFYIFSSCKKSPELCPGIFHALSIY